MATNLCSERDVKPRLARDLWQQCERDAPPCDSFYTKRNKLPYLLRRPKEKHGWRCSCCKTESTPT